MHGEQVDLDPMFSLMSMDPATPPNPPITRADASVSPSTNSGISPSADTNVNNSTVVSAGSTPKVIVSDIVTASASTSTRRSSMGDDPVSWRTFLVEGEQVN